MPLPREGHLSVLVEGGTSSATCRRVSQLEVCQLLSSSSQVIHPVGLNGCEVPVIASLPESLAKGTNLLRGEPIYLKVDIWQSIAEGPDLKVPPLGSHSSSILMPSLIKAPLLKVEREVSMTMEVSKLLSQVVLDTSGHTSGNSTPKRLDPVVLITPLPTRLGDFLQPMDTSSQVSTPNDAGMGDASLEEIPTASSPTAKTPGPSSGTPPADAGNLWEEANEALVELLLTKSSINTHWWTLVWEVSMALHQNDSKTTESIKEAKAICTCSTWEAMTLCSTIIREAKAISTHSTQEAKTLAPQPSRRQRSSAPILPRKLRLFAPWPSVRQRLREPLRLTHFNNCMLEEQAIKEESKGQLKFLLCLSSHPTRQPSRTPWHAGSSLPSLAWTCTDVPSFWPFPRSFTLWTSVCPWGSFLSCSWAFT